ncbi:MAG: C2 family cysteine protease [Microthrixaceae bacterium]
MSSIGCDPDALDGVAQLFSDGRSKLASLQDDLEDSIARLDWEGPHSDELRASWRSEVSAQFGSQVRALTRLRTILIENAQDQRKKSNLLHWVDLKEPKQGFLTDDHSSDAKRDSHGKKNFASVPLYSSEDGPSPSDVSQGGLGDCWLAAAMASMASTSGGRARLQRMIKDNQDGTYTVTFADGEQVTVDADLYVDGAQNPAYAGVSSGALWPAILEKAYAMRARDGFGGIEGGHAGDAFRVLGGYEVDTLALNPRLRRDPSNDSIVKLIQGQLSDSKPVTASSSGTDAEGHRFGHAWTVLDANEKYVTVRNPWGTNPYSGNEDLWNSVGISEKELTSWTPKSSSANSLGQGVLRIPVEDFTSGWDDLEYAK